MTITAPKESQWSEMISRLYPELHKELPDGTIPFSNTFTFQVTEECNLKCKYCLGGDTLIRMADYSQKPIKDIQIGDEVLGFDEYPERRKHTKVHRAVVEQLFQRTSDYLEVLFDGGEMLKVTANHKVLTEQGFTEIGQLAKDDTVYVLNGDRLMPERIASVRHVSEPIPVYNIGTSTHTYIANGIAVHNCYQGNKTKKVMSWETAKKAVDMLLSSTPENNSYINSVISPGIIIEFIGGEPFLQIDLIDKIATYFCKEARRLGHPWAERHVFSICSNGILYNDPRVQRFLYKFRKELSLSITIDGNKELHDSCRVFPDGSPSYDIAVAAAKDWMSKGHYLGSKITIAPGNVTYLYDALIHMVDLGYKNIHANCVYEKGWTEEHATIMYYQLKKFADMMLETDADRTINMSMFNEITGYPLEEGDDNNYCGGNGRMLCVDPSGHYATCIRYLPSSLGDDVPPLYFGHVDTGIGSTEEERKIIKDLKSITRRTCSTDECYYCPIASGCGWCSGLCYQENGTANKRVTHICIMHQSRVLANAYFWNRHYRKYQDSNRYKINLPKEKALKIIPESEWDMLNELAKED